MVARKGTESSVPKVVYGLFVSPVTHRRGQVQRDSDPAAGEVFGRCHKVRKVGSEQRPRTDLETSNFSLDFIF